MSSWYKPPSSFLEFVDAINIIVDIFGVSALLMLIWNTVMVSHITILTTIPYWHALAIRVAFMSLGGFYNPAEDAFRRKVLEYLKEFTKKSVMITDIEKGLSSPIPFNRV
jgi:hypothetical protein